MGTAFFLILLGAAQGIPDGNGTLEVQYEPKICFVAPCPQFKVISVNGEAVVGVGADITNLDHEKSAIRMFRKASVRGSWKTPDPKRRDYIEIVFEEWQVTISEKAS